MFLKLGLPPPLEIETTIASLREHADTVLEKCVHQRYQMVLSCLQDIQHTVTSYVKVVHDRSISSIQGSRVDQISAQARTNIQGTLTEKFESLVYAIGESGWTANEYYRSKTYSGLYFESFRSHDTRITFSLCGVGSELMAGTATMSSVLRLQANAFAMAFAIGQFQTFVVKCQGVMCDHQRVTQCRERTLYNVQRFKIAENNFLTFNFETPPSNVKILKNVSAQEMAINHFIV